MAVSAHTREQCKWMECKCLVDPRLPTSYSTVTICILISGRFWGLMKGWERMQEDRNRNQLAKRYKQTICL